MDIQNLQWKAAPALVLCLLTLATFRGHVRRRTLSGTQVHPGAVAAFGLLFVVGLCSAILLAVALCQDAASEGYEEYAVAAIVFIFLSPFLWKAFAQAFDTVRLAARPGNVLGGQTLRRLWLEEMRQRLSGRHEWAFVTGVSLVALFGLTFIGIVPCASLCLGSDFGKDYAFMAGWLGWFVGLCLVFHQTIEQGGRQLAVKILLIGLGAGAACLGFVYARAAMIVLWTVGVLSGGLFAASYTWAQAQPFWDQKPRYRTFLALLQMPMVKRVEALVREAAKGDVQAQLRLGKIFCYGQNVPADNLAAAQWFRRAADQGSAEAQFALCCLCCVTEHGVNWVEACRWCVQAADRGHTTASILREHLARILSPEDLAEGQRRATTLPHQNQQSFDDYSVVDKQSPGV